MRIWSIHPKYLDSKGLVALWRETLLAKRVLEGQTKGYRNHPQLDRFRKSDHPLGRINQYLSEVYEESLARRYRFDRGKVDWNFETSTMEVTSGQINFETEHLLKKLQMRDTNRYEQLLQTTLVEPHPMFLVVNGGIESWEMV